MAYHGEMLVFAPNRAGEQFMQALNECGKSFTLMACSSAEQPNPDKVELKSIIWVNLEEKSLINPPENEFSKVYIFEEGLEQCCKVLETIRKWTNGAMYVITKNHYPQMVYKALGADYVIRTTSDNLSFLIEKGAL